MNKDNTSNTMQKNKEKTNLKVRRMLSAVLFLAVIFIGFHIDRNGAASVEAAGKGSRSRSEIMSELRGWCDTIVHVESVCGDGADTIYKKKNFTGVVISADSSGTYLLTSDDGLVYSNEELEKIRKKNGLESGDGISANIYVVWDGDLKTEAMIVGESVQRNVAILKLAQNVNFDHVPEFANQNLQEKDSVWLLKYPQDMKVTGHISNDDVMMSMAKITKCYELDENQYFNMDAAIEDQSTGGPVFNENAKIVGFFLKTGGEYRTITADSICHILDSFNVPYSKASKDAAGKLITKKHIVLGIVLLLLISFYLKQRLGDKEKKKPAAKKESKSKSTNAMLEYEAGNRISNINKNRYIIGRSDSADYRMKDSKGISRMHAAVVFDGKQYYLEDLNSTNGTFVNGVRIPSGKQELLSDGDQIGVGDDIIVFRKK